MFVERKSRNAFDHCAVRAVTKSSSIFRPSDEMICPKYPEGFDFSGSAIHIESTRTQLAMKLGCLSCPYRNMKLPSGESAAQVIKRIGEQNAIDELNSLVQEHSPQPPQSPEQ